MQQQYAGNNNDALAMNGWANLHGIQHPIFYYEKPLPDRHGKPVQAALQLNGIRKIFVPGIKAPQPSL
jgi:hypothetical protein